MAGSNIDHDGPVRLQDANITHGFPSHIANLLNPESTISGKEFLSRLVHVCMIEVGFIPIIGENEEGSTLLEQSLLESSFLNSVPQLTRNLQNIIDQTGHLKSVQYKAIVEEFYIPEETISVQDGSLSNVLIDEGEPTVSEKDNIETIGSSTSTQEAKESGDALLDVTESSSEESMDYEDSVNNIQIDSSLAARRKGFSGPITVGIIFEGTEMMIIASGSDFNTNTQMTMSKYIKSRNTGLPTGTMVDFLRHFNFCPPIFATEVKRKFCNIIMDEINGLSFNMRSISSFPREVIVEIAKRCNALQIFRLKATCRQINNALSKNNAQFWIFLIHRDFPRANIQSLARTGNEDRYYEKYCDLFKFLLRRPLRRTIALSRIFP